MTRRRRVVSLLLLAGTALVVAAVLAEVALRAAKLPGVTYHTFQYDEITGQRFYPNTKLIYRNARGDDLTRTVNDWGYLDRDHALAKPEGVRRIGFFGDSFTEARQVPLDSTFSRRVERALNKAATRTQFECIAIGMMGYGTLQSYLECRRWMERLSLDEVVYVFCENDPGNLVPALNKSDACPYPVIVNDSLVVDRSFATRYANKRRWPHRTWQYLKSHTLLFSTLETRLHLLRSHGVRMRVDDADRLMGAPGKQATLSENTPPSAMPDSLRTQCMRLTEAVVLEWQLQVEAAGRRFTILYVPRPSEALKPEAERDDWAPWLLEFCARNKIAIVNPSERFFERGNSGEELFFDHLTSRGHALIAAAFLDERAGAR